MPATKTLTGFTDYVLQESISALSDEAYTNAKKLSGTAIVGSNPDIDPNSETFTGQIRWSKPFNPTINVASLSNATEGATNSYSQDFLKYIKTVRTYGAEKVNLQTVVTQQDGLAKIGRDFAEHRAQDEHNAILAVMKGVAISEMLVGAAYAGGGNGLGGQNYDNDPTSALHGFYVDNTAAALVQAQTAGLQGAARAEYFLQALAKAWKDYEPEYVYLFASPEVMVSLRSANLVDQDRVEDGNISFNTLFQGKVRLVQTRANQGFTSGEMTLINSGPGVNIAGGAKTSFLVLPGAIAKHDLDIAEPVEITRVGGSYNGGGSTTVWHRWGYVLAPAGYDWRGKETRFPTDGQYQYIIDSAASNGTGANGTGIAANDEAVTADAASAAVIAAGVPQKLSTYLNNAAAATLANTVSGSWKRKAASALSLGILPILHA